MVWPPPRFRTLMEESVRFATESVPAWVGLSLPGGGRVVYLGSQRMALAVVSRFAMRSCGGVVVLVREGSEEFGSAVLRKGIVSPGGLERLNSIRSWAAQEVDLAFYWRWD